MTQRKAAAKAKILISNTLKKKIVKKPTEAKKVVEKEDLVITVAPTVSLNVPKKTKLLFKDGVIFALPQEDRQFYKKAFTKDGNSAGALHFYWKSIDAEAIEFFTAHGDGVYSIEAGKKSENSIWVDSGSIFIVTKENNDKLLRAKKLLTIEDEDIGVANVGFQGKITAHNKGFAKGSGGLRLDTRSMY